VGVVGVMPWYNFFLNAKKVFWAVLFAKYHSNAHTLNRL
jgi:hypothetical protein